MKKTISLLLVLLAINLIHLKAQTADQIVKKYIEATGGQELIQGIKSQVIHAEMSVMGTTLSSEITMLVGKGFRSEANFQGQTIVQTVSPAGGWTINPFQGITEAQPLPDDQVKSMQSSYELGGALFNYKEKGSQLELLGNETINGVNAYQVKLTNKEGKEAFYFFDPATYYLLKQKTTFSANGQEMTSDMSFFDYQKTDISSILLW